MDRTTDRTRRPSSLPPSEVASGPLHVGWQRLRAGLRSAGLAPGLVGGAFRGLLGPRARLRPTPAGVVGLLDAYYRGQPDPEEGRWVHVDATTSARRVVSRLAAAAPELAPLALTEEDGALVLRTAGARVRIDPDDVEQLQWATAGAVYTQRTVSADALVEACNALLALREQPFRFLPLAAPAEVGAYLGVGPALARALDAVELWDGPLEALDRFAAWAELAAA